jgi:hypothetical protein
LTCSSLHPLAPPKREIFADFEAGSMATQILDSKEPIAFGLPMKLKYFIAKTPEARYISAAWYS